MRHFTILIAAITVILNWPTYSFAAVKSKKPVAVSAPAPAPEMKIDPALLRSYQSGTSIDSARVARADVQFLAVEPGLDFHQFQKFSANNDYFEVPLNGDSNSTVAPAIWIGHPNGAVWGSYVRARAGLDLSYLSHDGAQTVRSQSLTMDFKDNVSAHVLPMYLTVRLTSATESPASFSFSPWLSTGVGMMLTQVSGSLDGVSQTAWTPISKIGTGIRYSITGENNFVGGLSAGAFKVSGASKKAQWQGTGLTLAADILL